MHPDPCESSESYLVYAKSLQAAPTLNVEADEWLAAVQQPPQQLDGGTPAQVRHCRCAAGAAASGTRGWSLGVFKRKVQQLSITVQGGRCGRALPRMIQLREK